VGVSYLLPGRAQDAFRSHVPELDTVQFRFMMVIVVPVGVFQVRDAYPVAGRRCFGSWGVCPVEWWRLGAGSFLEGAIV